MIGIDTKTQFIEDMGLNAQADGLPRIAGRIFGLIVIADHPVNFDQIAERLQVSRGSISTNTRILEGLGMIVRTTRPGERQDYFRLAPNPYVSLLHGSQVRAEKSCKMVERTLAALGDSDPGAAIRLKELGAFYAVVSTTLADAVVNLSKEDA